MFCDWTMVFTTFHIINAKDNMAMWCLLFYIAKRKLPLNARLKFTTLFLLVIWTVDPQNVLNTSLLDCTRLVQSWGTNMSRNSYDCIIATLVLFWKMKKNKHFSGLYERNTNNVFGRSNSISSIQSWNLKMHTGNWEFIGKGGNSILNIFN